MTALPAAFSCALLPQSSWISHDSVPRTSLGQTASLRLLLEGWRGDNPSVLWLGYGSSVLKV